MLLLPSKRGAKAPPNVKIFLYDHPIPEVRTLEVLELLILHNRANTQFISQLNEHVIQTIGLIKRVTNWRQGLREEERLRLIEVLVVSRITYSLPYLHANAAECQKILCRFRKAYCKAALPARRSYLKSRCLRGSRGTVVFSRGPSVDYIPCYIP